MALSDLYQEEIKRITDVIRDKYKPEKIILFGSAARGEVRKDSDIDLLIIKDSDKKRHQRCAEVHTLLDNTPRRYPFEPIVMTPAEFARGQAEERYFIREILKDGKVLYEA